MFWPSLILSFALVAFGQPARAAALGVLAGAVGLALFWKSMLGVYVCVTLALGLQFGALSACLCFKTNNAPRPVLSIGFLRMLALAGAWVLLEWIRLFTCTGFTWNPVGLFLSCSTYSLQAASLFGIYGLSFWVILVNLAALRVLAESFSWRRFAFFCILAALPYGFGCAYIHIWMPRKIPLFMRSLFKQLSCRSRKRTIGTWHPPLFPSLSSGIGF